MYQPGDTFHVRFATHEPDTGQIKNADSTPTGTLIRNGSDTGETVTVSNKATGDYEATGTIPSGWAQDDEVELKLQAEVYESRGATLVTSNRVIRLPLFKQSIIKAIWTIGKSTVENATGYANSMAERILNKLGLLTSSTSVTIQDQVQDGGVLQIRQGESRLKASSSAIRVPYPASDHFDLSGYLIKFALKLTLDSGNSGIEVVGEVANAGHADDQELLVELTQAQTNGLSLDNTPINALAPQFQRGYAYKWQFSYANANSGTIQTIDATSVTLDSSAASINDFYNNQTISVNGGADSATITDYDGGTKVATVDKDMTGSASSGQGYQVEADDCRTAAEGEASVREKITGCS